MTVPALRELRRLFPDAHLTLATRSFAKGIFDGADFIDEVLVHDRGPGGFRNVSAQAREWRSRRFDLAILFPNAFEAALIAFLGRARFRIGYATQGRSLLLTHPLALPEWRGSPHGGVLYFKNILLFEPPVYWRSQIPAAPPTLDLYIY